MTLQAVVLDPNSFQLVNMANPRGKVAEIDNWPSELKKGILYFAPTVTGTPLNYGETHTTDTGLGSSELFIRGTVTDADGSRAVEFPIKITVTDGLSTSFSDTELQQTIPAVNGAGNPSWISIGRNSAWPI